MPITSSDFLNQNDMVAKVPSLKTIEPLQQWAKWSSYLIKFLIKTSGIPGWALPGPACLFININVLQSEYISIKYPVEFSSAEVNIWQEKHISCLTCTSSSLDILDVGHHLKIFGFDLRSETEDECFSN